MLEMYNDLNQLEKENKPIHVAIMGIGKMGKSLTDRLLKIPGMRPSLIINRNVDRARRALEDLGIPSEDIVEINSQNQVEELINENKYAISNNYSHATKAGPIQAIVEATGNPEYGARVAYESIINKKHIIMINVECDTVIGPSLLELARENGVVYTGAQGDEPAAIMELYSYAKALGFEVIGAGKGKNNPKNIYATNEDLEKAAEEKKLCPKTLTSFVDATNTMIELNAVANATGLKPDVFGCHGEKANLDNLLQVLSREEDGGIIKEDYFLDYIQGVAPGVFVIVKGDTDLTIETLEYVGMGKGPNYLLFRPFHMCSLETPVSIYKAVVKNRATIIPVEGQVCDTVAIAKRDMKKGESLDGIGSNNVYGSLTTHEDAIKRNLVPIALLSTKTTLKVDVKKDQLITYDMVNLDEDELITKLRRKQDANEK